MQDNICACFLRCPKLQPPAQLLLGEVSWFHVLRSRMPPPGFPTELCVSTMCRDPTEPEHLPHHTTER